MRTSRLALVALMTAAAAIGFLARPAQAQALDGSYDEPALRVGSALDVLDQNGRQRNFTDLRGKQGLIVAYGRQVDSCAVCQQRLAQLNASEPDFAKEGFHLAVITPDSPDVLMRFASRRKIGVPLLSDPDFESLKALSFHEDGEHHHDPDAPALALLDSEGRLLGSVSEADLRGTDIRGAVLNLMDQAGAREAEH